MKKTEEEIQEAARQYAIYLATKNSQLDPSKSTARKEAFVAGAKWMQEQDNKWIEIKSIEDLPNKEGLFLVFDKPTQSIMFSECKGESIDKEYWINNASHYIVIDIPEPPKH